MNYRHAYHAGNFADVAKHAVVAWIVRYLQQKPGPLCLIDTHAGAGVYDLAGTEAQKTGEAKDGIARLTEWPDMPAIFAPYLEIVRAANTGATLTRYPGSPLQLAHLARANDRIIAVELHPEDAANLRAAKPKANLRIVEGDGYRELSKLVPPPEKRGLVLIDPPFEEPDEFRNLAKAFIAAHRKWPTGVYVLWFPIKDEGEVERFNAELVGAGIKKLTFLMLDVNRSEGLSAAGLVVCNAPFGFEAEMRGGLAVLTGRLAQGAKPSSAVISLAGE
jgi:23S rRNA (adenine2030-N6)-methyltransferase